MKLIPKRLIWVSIALAFFVFSDGGVLAASRSEEGPDLVILNARIYNGKSKKVRTGGIAVKDGRIIAVDRDYKIRDMMVRNTKRLDARGQLVLPGFNDSHTHFMAIGNLFSSIDLKNVRRPEEIPKLMRNYVRFLPKGRWILGGNWNSADWTPNTLPTRRLIDAVTPETPVLVYSSDPNTALVNSLALKMAGIGKNKTSPIGGEIEKDSDGEPTGIIRGNAILLVRNLVPQFTTKEQLAVAETATNYAASLGVTSVQDMHSDYIAEIFRTLKTQGKLKNRIYDCTPLFEWKKLAAKGLRRASGDTFVREGCLKSFAVSGVEAENELYEAIRDGDRAGFQVMIHSIGGAEVRSVLNLFRRAAAENGPGDRRFRVEHAARFFGADLRRFGKEDVIPSMQPHLFGGYEPYRSFLKSDAKMAFGSDASITDFNPLLGIYAAVNIGSARERLTVAEAVNAYTAGSAYAEFQEDEKGTIEKGKLADLVFLSEDIFAIPPGSIRDAHVVVTILNGEIVYDRRTGS